MEIESCFVFGSLEPVVEAGAIVRRVVGWGVWCHWPWFSILASSMPELDDVAIDVATVHAVKYWMQSRNAAYEVRTGGGGQMSTKGESEEREMKNVLPTGKEEVRAAMVIIVDSDIEKVAIVSKRSTRLRIVCSA